MPHASWGSGGGTSQLLLWSQHHEHTEGHPSTPSLTGAALCPHRQEPAALLYSIPRDIILVASVERDWAHIGAVGTNLPAPSSGTIRGCPALGGAQLPHSGEREQCWQCPSWALSPALHGHSSRKDGAGGCRGRAAPQTREALPAGERKPCSPHYLGSFAPCLSRPAWAVSPCPQGSLFLFPWFTVQAFQRDELPSTEGVLQMAPRLSVRLGCEDEEPVFLLADPLHELVDSTDGTRLGPQRTVTYVELKGAGDPSQEVFTWAREVDVLQGP